MQDDDDEFKDFDVDLTQIDEVALKVLDGDSETKKGKFCTGKILSLLPLKKHAPVSAPVSAPSLSVVAPSPPVVAPSPPVVAPSPPVVAPSPPVVKRPSKKRATVFIDDDDNDDVEMPLAQPLSKPKSPLKLAEVNPSAQEPAKPKPKSPPKHAEVKSTVQETVKRKEVGASSGSKDETVSAAAPPPSSQPTEASKKANYMKMLAKKAAGGGGPSAPGSKEIPVGEENCLTGLTFVFTGELSSISRDDAQNLVKRYGGRVTGAVSGKTSYLVAGEDSGESKLSKAKSVKVKIIDEDGFLDVIASSKGKPSSGSSTPSAKAGKKAVGTDVKENMLKESTSSMSSSSFYGSSSKGKAPATSTEIRAPKPHSSELWTTKYKPTRYEDVLGNKKNVEKLAIWLKGWSASTVTPKPSSAKDDPGKSRAILISGPPGIGKTTAAHLVAKLEGFEIVEFNASDTRSKKAVGDVVKEMTGSHTLAEYFTRDSKSKPIKRQVLIMDEVDGMSAGDRGGVAELINVIKNTKVPIICICNDRQSPKVKSLVNHCFDMRFARPRTTEIEKAIKVIAAKEGLDIKINAMEAMVQSTHADIRQILNMLSTYALQSSELSFDQSRALSKSSEKNMTMSPWDVTGTLFNRVSFRETSFADKLELYFSDFSLIPLMIQENYIKMDPVLAKENGGPNKAQQDIEALNLLSNAADAIAHADIISSVQMKTQNWGLLPFHGVTSTIRPAFFTHGSLVNTGSFYGGGYAFPSWLGKNSNQSKNVRLLKEIQLHMRLHVSADKNEVRQSYLPALAPLITLPLAKDSSGVEQVIQTMDDYYLTREDWDSILDLGLDECSAKALTADIPTATKTAFTRTYNKANHPKPFMTASLLSKSRGGGGGMSGVPDLEEAFENDDEGAGVGDDEDGAGEDADEDDVGADRLIKKKEKAAPRKSAASGSGTKGGKRGADGGAKASASKKVKK
ncbi:hypothetical protein HDU78_004373 [Chytriomyces hyalinus]|nr:hypothetical protein HDU78_004373 [Chytriomyces hyalinus]